jgi:steroid 5-alpha reductase family enzyme
MYELRDPSIARAGWQGFLAAGGQNASMLGATGATGIALFAVGSWMNTYAEYGRENRGLLYTQELFRYSRHPNFLGDLLSFSGLCLISGAWVTP